MTDRIIFRCPHGRVTHDSDAGRLHPYTVQSSYGTFRFRGMGVLRGSYADGPDGACECLVTWVNSDASIGVSERRV